MNGSFTAAGEPVARGEVVWLRGERFAGLAATGADGRFALDVEADGTDAVLVGRMLGDPLGVTTTQVVVGADEVALDARGPWHAVLVDVRPPADAAHPARLTGFLDPLELEGATIANATAALLQSGPSSQRAHFASVSLPEPATTLHLQPGRWRIGASFVVHESPMSIDPQPPNVVAGRASVDERDLRGDAWSGFEIDVDGPLTVTLQLRVVGDDEL